MTHTAARRDAAGQTMLRGPPARRPRRGRFLMAAALVLSAGAVAAGLTVWPGGSGPSGSPLPTRPAPGATAPGAPANAAALAAGVEPAVVDIVITAPGGRGAASATGMVLSRSGLVATSAHVVEDGGLILITCPVIGRTFGAHVVAVDTQVDVALVQIEGAAGLTPIRTSPTRLTPGEGVVAVGNADGGTGPPTFVAGSVTGLDRVVSVANPMTGAVQTLTGLIETNAPVVSGDSGGALVDPTGGVVAMVAAGNGDFERDQHRTRGWAVPIGQVLRLALPFQPPGGG